jgi:hypothetical protein
VILRIEKIKLADHEIQEAEEKNAENKAKAEERLKERLGA